MTPGRARLALEDGSVFEGVACGADGVTSGEVVFNTSMTGYQEILTDPSYAGQIVTMTCPEMGNYGTTTLDAESKRPFVAGFIVRECSPLASNWRSVDTLHDFLCAHHIVALSGIDTRALTRRLRSGGVLRGAIGSGRSSVETLVERARQTPPMEGADLVRAVTCAEPFDFGGLPGAPLADESGVVTDREFVLPGRARRDTGPGGRPLVAAYDFGMKWNILRRLRGVRVRGAGVSGDRAGGRGPGRASRRRLPEQRSRRPGRAPLRRRERARAGRDRAAALRHLPGPPDARAGARRPDVQAQVRPPRREPPGEGPGDGPRGDHRPEPRLRRRGRLAAARRAWSRTRACTTGRSKGCAIAGAPVFSVQYHPEASPGPHDADYLFGRFLSSIRRD